MPRWTEETTQAMLRLRDAGQTFHYIGGRLGFSPDYVRRKLRETAPATVRQRRELSDDEVRQLYRLLDAGMDCRAIAETMGRSLSTIKNRAYHYRKGIQQTRSNRALRIAQAKPRIDCIPPEPAVPIVPPRTITNATMHETLTGGDWTPNRPGAMDYARIPSRGIA